MAEFRGRIIRNIGLAAVLTSVVLAGVLYVSLNLNGTSLGTSTTTQTSITTPTTTSSSLCGPFGCDESSTTATGSTITSSGNGCADPILSVKQDFAIFPFNSSIRALAFDPHDDEIFIPAAANSSEGLLYAVSGLNNSAVAAIAQNVGVSPYASAFDPVTDSVYVTDRQANYVIIVNAATDTVTSNVPIGTPSGPIIYDPSNQEIFVGQTGNESIVVINATNGEFVRSINLAFVPSQFAYDSSNGMVYAVGGSTTISEVNPSNQVVLTRSGLGINFDQMTFDPVNGYLYLSSSWYGDVILVNPSNLAATADNISLPIATQAIGFDQNTGDVFVAANGTLGGFYVVDGNAVVANYSDTDFVPEGIAYNSVQKDLLVSGPLQVLLTISTSCASIPECVGGIQMSFSNPQISEVSPDSVSFVNLETLDVNVTSHQTTNVTLSADTSSFPWLWVRFYPSELYNVGPHGASAKLFSSGSINDSSNELSVSLLAQGNDGSSACGTAGIDQNFNMNILNGAGSFGEQDLSLQTQPNGSVTVVYRLVYDPPDNLNASTLSPNLSVVGIEDQNGSISPMPPWLALNFSSSSFTLNAYEPSFVLIEATAGASASGGTYNVAVSEVINSQNYTGFFQVLVTTSASTTTATSST